MSYEDVYENKQSSILLNSLSISSSSSNRQMESQEDLIFKKNDVVYAICNNQLPWPAQISKIVDDNYHVNFIGHKSKAAVRKDKLIPFENQYTSEILKEYKTKNDSAFNRILRAIEDSRHIQDKIKRKEEREANKEKKPKKAKENKAEKPKVEKSTRTRNQSKRNAIAEQKEVKVQAVTVPLQQPIQEIEKIQVQKSVSSEVKNEFNHQMSNQQNSSISHSHVGPIQLQQKEVSPISSMVQELKPLEDQDEYIEENSYVSQPENNEQDNRQNPDFSVTSNQQLQIVIPVQDNHYNHPEEEFQQEITQPQEYQQILKQVVNGQMEQYNGPVIMSEMKRFQPTTPIDFICMYLQKMTNYLSRLIFQPLNKEEKEHLAELLMNHRKVHDEPRLLDHMVRFIEAFDFKLKQERKKCFVEYIKIKERVECCLVFRSQMTYDQEINKILDRYVNRFNQQ